MKNHYFDINHSLHPYTFSVDANPNSIAPKNALRKDLPPSKEGFHIGEQNGEWVYIENHMQKKNSEGLLTGGTPFWLPEDTYDMPPRYMSDYGPLPENAILTRPAQTEEDLKKNIQIIRDKKLSMSDKYMLIDYPINQYRKNKWKEYRQALRDITKKDGYPWKSLDQVPWPDEPIFG